MICPNCSTVLPDSSLTCSNCGAQLVPVAGENPYSWDGAAYGNAAGTAAAAQAQAQAAQATQAQEAGRSAFRDGFEQGYGWAQDRKASDSQQAYEQAYQYGYQQGYQQAANPNQQGQAGYYQAPPAPAFPATQKNHIVAGLLAIFLGTLGIHKFYLGYTTQGVTMLLVSLLGSIITLGLAYVVMAIIALIEGIIYLTKNDAEFYYTYELGQKTWF